MAGVNLSLYRFDYDLTFAALLMHPDGTLYHTYAGRTHDNPSSHQTLSSLLNLMEATLAEHARYQAAPTPPTLQGPTTIEEIPTMARKIEAGEGPSCFHCHMVHDFRRRQAQESGTWKRSEAFVWPDPIQLGIRVERERQTAVSQVTPGSAAAVVGLRPGDHLLRCADQDLLTFGDLQRPLHAASSAATQIPLRWDRQGKPLEANLVLRTGWKVPDPRVFSWRASKWGLGPRPGFGGRQLSRAELTSLGLPQQPFAFEVGYLVTWGPHAHTGRNAARAGLRKGDLVLSVAGKDDFVSVDHFHAWFRLTRTAGSTVEVKTQRSGKPQAVQLPVIE
jgi:hypothetical protein